MYPAEWASALGPIQAKYRKWMRARSGPQGFWATGQAHRLDEAFNQGRERIFEPGNISIKGLEDGVLNVGGNLHRPPSEHARRPDRHHLGGRQSLGLETHHLSATARRKCAGWPNPAKNPRNVKGAIGSRLPS